MNFLIPSFRSVTRFAAQVLLIVAAGFCVNAQAADPFVIKDIRIEGLQRVEPGTVFSYLPVQVGDSFTEEKSAEAIKALYSTGFFRDVQIQAQGNVLIVIVEERPTISRIEFTGMKEFDQEVVRKSLRTVGVADARFFRAWGYFNLLQRYGGVPLVTKTLTDDSPELSAGSATREEVRPDSIVRQPPPRVRRARR
ncbi:MAG: hypothetical protein RJA46_635, partial [Pseudomonadota bacterium]